METPTVVLPRPRSRPTSLAVRRTVSLTDGCDTPLRILASAPRSTAVRCHPYDEAIVRHLLAHVARTDAPLEVDLDVPPGVLAVSVQLPVPSRV